MALQMLKTVARLKLVLRDLADVLTVTMMVLQTLMMFVLMYQALQNLKDALTLTVTAYLIMLISVRKKLVL